MKHCKILRYLFTAAALLSGLGFGLVGSAQPALAVTDLAPSHWAASTINAYVSRGIMSGYPDGTFRPDASVTRAEFVKMVNSVFGYNTPTTINFPDVSTNYWGYDEIAKAVYAGYVNGDENGYFNPESPLTREEAASIICRIKGLAPNQTASSNYTDSSRIASWAAPYVGAVTQFGYMQGNGDGTFNPTKPLSRAEAASVLSKAESSKTYTSNNGSSGSSGSSSSSNNNNSNTLHRDNYSTSTSDTVKDYTMSTRDKSLANKTITGNLYIPSGIGSSTINLDDLTVEGTVYVRGGGTIDVDNCDFNKVVLDKAGVSFITDTHTTVDELEFWRNGRIEGKGYGEVTIADNSVSSATVNATVDSLLLDTDADLRLGRSANIDELEVTSKADNADVYFASDAYVEEMRIYDHIDITGSGEINKMYTYVSGIYSSIEPNRLVTSGSGTKPNYTDRDDDDNSSSNNNNNNNNNNSNNNNSTPSDKNLVVTGNIDGSDAKKGNATYDTVTVTRAGVTISNVIIDKNLTIEAAVADGNVTLDHVTVKGQVYIHGGGQNSIIFSDCTLEKNIYVDKKPTEKVKQPVGLKLNNGTTIKGDIVLQNNANIATSPKEHIVNSVIVDGTLTEPLKIDAHIDNLTVKTSGKINIELDNSNINSLVAKNAAVIAKGKGNINDVTSVPNLNVDMLTPPDEDTRPNLPNFKAIISLSGIPETIEQGGTIQLNNIQAKYSDNSTATISNVVWAVTDDTAGVTRTDNLLTATKTGSFTLTGAVKNGVSIGKDFVSPPFKVTVTEVFIPADKITAEIRTAVTLTESANGTEILPFTIDLKTANVVVTPSNATNKNITWSVKGNGASLKDNVLTLKEAGDITLTATIPNGKKDGNTTETFKIKVDRPYRAVGNIVVEKLEPKEETTGDKTYIIYQAYANSEFTLNTKITDEKGGSSPTKTAIEWTLVKSDNTGITQDNFKNNPNPTLKPTNPGEMVLKAVIKGGLNEGKDDYEQEIRIKVNPSLVGEIKITPEPLKEERTYYPTQKIEFSLDDKIMDAYDANLEWSINNQKTIDRYITDENAKPKLDATDKNGLATLSIPENFPTDKNIDIEIRVNNKNNRDAYRTEAITVAKFIKVTNITNTFETDVTLPSNGEPYSINLSQIKITPADATMRDVTWSIKEADDTTSGHPTATPDEAEANLDGNTLLVGSPGQVTVTATVKNGAGPNPGEDYTKDFTINVEVPLLSDIINETESLIESGDYLAGQTLTFTMGKAVMEKYGANIEWSVSGSGITTSDYQKDATSNKLILTIPDNFRGGAITVKAVNGDETKELSITALPFTSFDGTKNIFQIFKPANTTGDPDVKIGGTIQLTYEANGMNKDLQKITWGFDPDVTQPTSQNTKIDSNGLLTIGADEKTNSIQIIATMENGKLVDNKLEYVVAAANAISVDLGKVSQIEASPKDSAGPDAYYAGQKITFKTDNLATDYGSVEWSIKNLDTIKQNTSGSLPTLDAKTGVLTIPADYEIKPETQTITIQATVNGGGAAEKTITVVPFTPAEISITASYFNASYVSDSKNVLFSAGQNNLFKLTATVPDSWQNKYKWVPVLDNSVENETTKIDATNTLTIDHRRTKPFTVYAVIENGKIDKNGSFVETKSNVITFTPFMSVSYINIADEKTELPDGTIQVKLTATVDPANADQKDITWSKTTVGSDYGEHTKLSPTTGSNTVLTIDKEQGNSIFVTARIKDGILQQDGTKIDATVTITVSPDGTVTSRGGLNTSSAATATQSAAADSKARSMSMPSWLQPANQEEEEKEEKTTTNNTYNEDRKIEEEKTAAEIRAEEAAAERERIEAEKAAQKNRNESIQQGGGVSKRQAGAN